ncbi:MAG: AAA family ATPase [Candidatus Andersenbacteria bacterium]|nr:AAA family ATPase [Candidatus Andersenbacteria bacterium]
MFIAKIKEIKNVGTFANFVNGGSLGFEKLTFIYGLNTFGKTTIAEIFQSLKDNNSEIITSRKTIPIQQIQQKTTLSIKKDQNEKDLLFQNNIWGQNNISKYLEVFGTDFIYKNLFTGLSIERSNKENFTQFVLGEKGVLLAQKIAEDKKSLGDKKRGLPIKLPDFLKTKNEIEIDNFLNLSINNLDIENLNKSLLDLKKQKQDEESRLKEPQKILDIENIFQFNIPNWKIVENLENINNCLQNDYSSIKDEVLKKLESHIKNTFNNKENTENWIKQGLNNCKDKNGNCPFCSQSLENAKDLMSVYDSYFDQEYSNFIIEVENNLSQNKQNFININFILKTSIQNLLTTAFKYKEILTDKDFQILLIEFEEKINLLDEDILNTSKNSLLNTIKNKIDEKNKKPYLKIKKIDYSELENKITEYKNILIELQDIVKNIQEKIATFKKQYKNIKVLQDKITILFNQINTLEYQKARIEQNKDCENYNKELKNILDLEQKIKTDEEILRKEQNEYLKNYFSKINELFKNFGSQNFVLEKGEDSRGYQPVYFLKVKFHNIEITNEQLKTVFSESDRRALALAIFWTKIDLKTEQEKQKTIVVLDDPITSFDDNRILSSINLFKNSLDELSQIIFLTHYPNFIKNFCERTKEKSITTKFLKIEKNNVTSFLSLGERRTFTESQYEKIFTKIYGFIEREHNNCIKTDLRPFLENLYMPTFFANKLKEAKKENKDVNSLEKIIDYIFIDESIKKKFHSFRTDLNPDSHIFTSSNEEDVRNFAKEMMEFLYSFEFTKLEN